MSARLSSPCIVACAALVVATVPAVAGDALPYTLAVRVEYDGTRGAEGTEGPASLVDDLRRRVIHDLEDAEVVREVLEDLANPGELVLWIVLDDYLEETAYATSMAMRQQYDDPVSQQQYTVLFQVRATVRLEVGDGGAVVRSFRFKESLSRPPRYHGEDTAAALREEALTSMVRIVRKSTFKGSRSKLVKKIEAASNEAP